MQDVQVPLEDFDPSLDMNEIKALDPRNPYGDPSDDLRSLQAYGTVVGSGAFQQLDSELQASSVVASSLAATGHGPASDMPPHRLPPSMSPSTASLGACTYTSSFASGTRADHEPAQGTPYTHSLDGEGESTGRAAAWSVLYKSVEAWRIHTYLGRVEPSWCTLSHVDFGIIRVSPLNSYCNTRHTRLMIN